MPVRLSPNLMFIRDRFTWLAYWMLAYFAYLQASLSPIVPFLRAENGMNYTVSGLHLSAFAIGIMLSGLFSDRIAQRVGRRAAFWTGALGMAAGALLLTLFRPAPLTIVSALVMGAFGSLLLVMVQSTLSDHHGRQRAIALTEANVLASLGTTAVPLLVGLFEQTRIGWRGAVYAAVVFLALLAWRSWSTAVPAAPPPPAAASGSRPRLPWLFWVYWLVIVLAVAVEWSLIFWSPGFLETVTGLSRVNAATVMSLFFGAVLIGRLIGSRLTRHFPSRLLLLGALVITAVGFGIYWRVEGVALTLLGLALTGLGVANLFPLTLATATNLAADQADRASARLALGGGFAIFSAPLVIGRLADSLDLQQAFGVVGVLVLVATAVVVFANIVRERVVEPAV